jgi:hypothetical protein
MCSRLRTVLLRTKRVKKTQKKNQENPIEGSGIVKEHPALGRPVLASAYSCCCPKASPSLAEAFSSAHATNCTAQALSSTVHGYFISA